VCVLCVLWSYNCVCVQGGGKSLFGRNTWKERMFELTDTALEYYVNSSATEVCTSV
jgi:hypothetical protein